MNELLGDKLIREAVRIRLHDMAEGTDYTTEEAAIAALAVFEHRPLEILRLKDELTKAVDFILKDLVLTDVDPQG